MSRKSMLVNLMIICFMFTFSGMASGGTIAGSKHDFSKNELPIVTYFAGNFTSGGDEIRETCVFCHTPHAASTAVTGFLWNRTGSSVANYDMYTSTTLSVVPDSRPTGLTLMCMSCHDGVTSIAVGTLINAPGAGPVDLVAPGAYQFIGEIYYPSPFFGGEWQANIGNLTPDGTFGTRANLSDDHPVSFTWNNNVPGIFDPGEWTGVGATALKLFNNRMECSTCHNVHDNTNAPFLRMSNADSAMCTTCHDK